MTLILSPPLPSILTPLLLPPTCPVTGLVVSCSFISTGDKLTSRRLTKKMFSSAVSLDSSTVYPDKIIFRAAKGLTLRPSPRRGGRLRLGRSCGGSYRIVFSAVPTSGHLSTLPSDKTMRDFELCACPPQEMINWLHVSQGWSVGGKLFRALKPEAWGCSHSSHLPESLAELPVFSWFHPLGLFCV